MRFLLGALALVAGIVSISAAAQTSPSNFTSATRYDAARRVTGTIAPDPDGAGPLRYAATRTQYDSAGRVARVEQGALAEWQAESVAPLDWQGFTLFKQVDFTYDSANRKLTEKVLSGGTAYALTQYSYDAAGRLDCIAVRMNPAVYGTLPPSACTLWTQGEPDNLASARCGLILPTLSSSGPAGKFTADAAIWAALGCWAIALDG